MSIYKRVSIGHSINYSLVDFKSRYDPEHKDTVNSLRSRFSNGYPGDPETLCACASVGNLVVGRAFLEPKSVSPYFKDHFSEPTSRLLELFINVDETYQTHGIGRLLFDMACTEGTERGYGIFIEDATKDARFYGGKNTTRKFNVNHFISGQGYMCSCK